MEEEGEGPRLSKRFSDKGGEVDFKTKAGTAWSHSYLNQKPWHPLSYPNQRRKWIAEQTHANRERRAEEVAREFTQEQEFFRQTALVSKKEKEKMETMKAVSFMYVRPPGYNAESAKAAEIADERRKEEEGNLQLDGEPMSMPLPSRDQSRDVKKKPVPKDVFGRALPTEEQFEVLKNAPRLETGAPARVKPFAVEVRNVKCLRCGNYGHQSGDRECPLKDAIMPNEEIRLKRDDPLTAMLAHTDSSEPLKWELKQKPGMSPPRGGFDPEDPNQQIVAEDIFDEYGGFLGGENIPELLANFSSGKAKKKSKSKKKHKRRPSPTGDKSRYHDEDGASSDDDERQRSKERKLKTQKHRHSELTSPDDDEGFRVKYGNNDEGKRSKKRNQRHHKRSESHSLDDAEFNKHHKRSRCHDEDGASSDDDEGIRETYGDDDERKRSKKRNDQRRNHRRAESHSSEDAEFNKKHHKRIRHKHSYSSEDDGRRRSKHHHRFHHHHHHHHRQLRYHSDYSSE